MNNNNNNKISETAIKQKKKINTINFFLIVSFHVQYVHE